MEQTVWAALHWLTQVDWYVSSPSTTPSYPMTCPLLTDTQTTPTDVRPGPAKPTMSPHTGGAAGEALAETAVDMHRPAAASEAVTMLRAPNLMSPPRIASCVSVATACPAPRWRFLGRE